MRYEITTEQLRTWAATGQPRPWWPGMTILGHGAELGTPPPPNYQPSWVAIPDTVRSGHLGCFGTTRVGKAQPLDAWVHTPAGFRRMGEIKPGDRVSTPTGVPAAVRAVFPQGRVPIYRVRLEDGRVARASGDHLWLVSDHTGIEKLLSTDEVRERLGDQPVWLPLTAPMDEPPTTYPLPPYLLGGLLADRLISNGRQLYGAPWGSGPDLAWDWRTQLEQAVARWGERTGCTSEQIYQAVARVGARRQRAPWGSDVLAYRGGTVADRLDMIRGVVDAAGTVLSEGEAFFVVVLGSAAVAALMQQLVWSVGGVAWTQQASAEVWRLGIWHPRAAELVTLPTKREAVERRQARRPAERRGVAVVAVEPDGDAEAQCLWLDEPTGCYLTDDYIVTHNTRLIEAIVEQDIHKGYSVVIVDPKGDHELFNRVIQAAVEAGRLDEVMLLTPVFPEASIRVGPLTSYYMQDELVNMLISGVKAREDYFIAIAQEVSQAVVAGLIKQRETEGDQQPLTFQDVKDRIGFKDLQAFIKELDAIPGAGEIVHNLRQMVDSPNLADFWSKVSSSFRTSLSALTFGATGEIMGRATTNVVIERLGAGQPVILVAQTGSLLTQRTSVIVGKMLISMIQALVGRLFASGRTLTPPLCLHLDEGHNVLYAGFQELINKGGGANCWVHFYTQSLAQIEAEVGAEYARSIVDNINTWVYFLVNHPETAAHIEQASPLRERFEPVLPWEGDASWRVTQGPAIQAERVLQLPKREFYCRSYGTVWRAQTVEMRNTWLKVRWPVIGSQGKLAQAERESG